MTTQNGSTDTVSSTESSATDASQNQHDDVSRVADEGTQEGSSSSADANPSGHDSQKSKDDEKKDLLSVVRDAVSETRESEQPTETKKKDTDESSTSKAGTEGAKPKASEKQTTEDEGELTDDEVRDLKPRTKKYVSRILRERSELREEVENYRPRAENFMVLENFMNESQLSPDEVSQALTISAMFKSDPVRAREELVKRIEILDGFIGNKLSAELQRRVDDGELDEESARDISRANAAAERERIKAANAEAQRTQHIQQSQSVDLARQINGMVTNWAQQKAQVDPDYQRKAPMLATFTQALVARHGRPATAEQAIKMAEFAYNEVNKQIDALAPKQPQPTPPRQLQEKRVVTSRPTSGTSKSVPNTALDVVRAALGE